MRIFSCPACDGPLFFHNLNCVCGVDVAYDPSADCFTSSINPCKNRSIIACNWNRPAESESLCRSCAMTSVIPDLSLEVNRLFWSEAELSKRWVLANLARWHWFTACDNGPSPEFHLLSEQTVEGHKPVTIGHGRGIITINVAEADPVHRVAQRQSLGEPFRTMIGHFRHEIGHFVFSRLIQNEQFHSEFQRIFGNETGDYGAALQSYYAGGGIGDWQKEYVTAYASSHPLEDWAESFAHALHLVDIVDSAVATGLTNPTFLPPDYDSYREADAERLLTVGSDLGVGLNHVNRSMGLSDIYPFVLTPAVRLKLKFVHASVGRFPLPPATRV